MKILKFAMAAFSVLLANPASAALLEFEFSGVFDRPNEFGDIGTSYSGKFGYDSAIAPDISYILDDDAIGHLSYAHYTSPSIFLTFNAGGKSFGGNAEAYVSNSQSDGHDFGLYIYGNPDFIMSLYFADGSIYDLTKLDLPTSFPSMGLRPDPYDDWEDADMPNGELDFLQSDTGFYNNAPVARIAAIQPCLSRQTGR